MTFKSYLSIFYEKHIDITHLPEEICSVQAIDPTGSSDDDVPAAHAAAALFGV